MPTDYNKMKVAELKDALSSRKLPTNGNKPDLIARLQADDVSAAPSGSETTTSAPPAASHLPSADEYEVDWDHDEKDPAKPAESSASTQPAAAAAPVEEKKDDKPKRKTIASLFDTPAPAPKAGNEPSSPSTVTDETTTPAQSVAPTSAPAPTVTFSANLPTTSLDEEIARRKKRAERFGLSAEESDALKALERQKRFGAVAKEDVKGLDQALPEREKKRRGEGQGGRGGKRGRFQDRDATSRRNGGRGGNGNGNARSRVEGGRVQKTTAVTVDPEEKRKAEERRKRFAGAS